MQVIKGPGKRVRLPEGAFGTGTYCYRWAERHEIFKAAYQVTLDERNEFSFAYLLGLLMLAGLRVEEAARMRWEPPADGQRPHSWPDMRAWQIEIPDGRNPQSRRLIPIIPQLARMLTYWPTPKRGPLFPFELDSDQIEKCWTETLRIAGVKRVGIPALRNTYSLMMQDVFGLSANEVARLLGQPRKGAPGQGISGRARSKVEA